MTDYKSKIKRNQVLQKGKHRPTIERNGAIACIMSNLTTKKKRRNSFYSKICLFNLLYFFLFLFILSFILDIYQIWGIVR